MTLYLLLDYLATRPPDLRWQGWEIRRVSGGHNNLLYLDVTDLRRAWVMRRYAEIVGVDQIAVRSWVCFCLMCCDWAFFFARKAHEHAADLAPKARLVDRPAEWYHGLPRQRDCYTALARRLLDGDPLRDTGVRV